MAFSSFLCVSNPNQPTPFPSTSQAKKARLDAAATASVGRAATDAATRRANLDAGFAAAFAAAAADARVAAATAAASGDAPPKSATAAEVARVLAAPDDAAVLGVPPGAGAAALRARYRELAVALHPDKCAHADAKAAFQRLVEAYGALQKYLR